MPIVGGASVDSADSDLRNDVQTNNDIMNAPTRSQKGFGNNGSLDLPGKIENFKAWSSTAMRCTKQAIEEKLGTTSPTRDPETQAKIEEIKQVSLCTILRLCIPINSPICLKGRMTHLQD
ncbi:ADP-ribosylation factor interacting protein [Echinococcus granulosus]|uniref:ADP-ribosylation factor interacting protein n=1 Tax=Echinococcus granulosus TaxID=6210 RepID=W6UIZ4_ECHGR|nr:ADP-ribosylation factor interacting protein [Echinococcus granulosus]EUB60998.1 ADP-ribosylation factor interacting protein [Echinococcus granulosus]